MNHELWLGDRTGPLRLDDVLPDLWETGCNVLAFCDCLDCVIILIDCPMALFAERGFFIDERSTCGRLFPSLIQLWHKTKK